MWPIAAQQGDFPGAVLRVVAQPDRKSFHEVFTSSEEHSELAGAPAGDERHVVSQSAPTSFNSRFGGSEMFFGQEMSSSMSF